MTSKNLSKLLSVSFFRPYEWPEYLDDHVHPQYVDPDVHAVEPEPGGDEVGLNRTGVVGPVEGLERHVQGGVGCQGLLEKEREIT